jgi:hypothetical protein
MLSVTNVVSFFFNFLAIFFEEFQIRIEND